MLKKEPTIEEKAKCQWLITPFVLRLYLQEVLHTLWVVAVALSTDPLHLFDLARLAGCLDVLKVNFRVLTEIHNRAQEVEQT